MNPYRMIALQIAEQHKKHGRKNVVSIAKKRLLITNDSQSQE
jgi:hypothetical protein